MLEKPKNAPFLSQSVTESREIFTRVETPFQLELLRAVPGIFEIPYLKTMFASFGPWRAQSMRLRLWPLIGATDGPIVPFSEFYAEVQRYYDL